METIKNSFHVFIPDMDEFTVVVDYIVNNFIGVKGKEVSFKSDKECSVTSDSYEIVFTQSGVGKTATSRSVHKELLNYTQAGYFPERFILMGTACGLKPNIYEVTKCCQEIDLTPAGRKLGESPDEPLYYINKPNKKFCLKTASSLNVERFCTEFPDVNLYGLYGDGVVVDMEDYAFSSMMYTIDVPYTIIRGVTDSGQFEDWKEATESMVKSMMFTLFNRMESM